MRHAPRTGAHRRERGVTMFGLLFWAIAAGMVAYVAMRVFPTVNEYLTIRRAINKVAASSPGTVSEARQLFDRQKEVEYAISTISGKDLEITKENDQVVIGFAYDKEVPLYGPVYLLIKYEGRSTSR